MAPSTPSKFCEVKCSVAENSANNSCSAFFFKLLAVKNPLVSSLIVELKYPSVGFNTFSAHISTKLEKLPYFARIKTGPLRPLYCPDRPKHPSTLLKRQLSSFRAGFVRNKHIAPQMPADTYNFTPSPNHIFVYSCQHTTRHTTRKVCKLYGF